MFLPSVYLLLKSLRGAQVGINVRHTCIAYIIKSKLGSKEKNVILLDQDVHICGYVYGG